MSADGFQVRDGNAPASLLNTGLRPGVTVVISTYNRSRYLPEALRSILAQTVPPSRIVVIDDGSTDGTVGALAPFVDRIEYIRQENGGKARALNRVLPTVDTEFVWFFDDDDAAYPDALAKLAETLHADPACGFAFGAFDVGHSEAGSLLAAAKRPAPYLHADKTVTWQRLELFRACTLMMSGALIRTAAAKAVGGLNEALIRGQDYDLMLRLAARFPFRYCGSSVYVWREHEGARGSAAERHAHDDRIRTWARYNRPIGDYLHTRLPLALFLPDDDTALDCARARRKALIVRAWAIANKLPATTAAAELCAAFEADAVTPLDQDERRLLEQLFHHDFVVYRLPIPLRALARLLGCAPGCVALTQLARGLYWLGHTQRLSWRKTHLLSRAALLYAGGRCAALWHRPAAGAHTAAGTQSTSQR